MEGRRSTREAVRRLLRTALEIAECSSSDTDQTDAHLDEGETSRLENTKARHEEQLFASPQRPKHNGPIGRRSSGGVVNAAGRWTSHRGRAMWSSSQHLTLQAGVSCKAAKNLVIRTMEVRAARASIRAYLVNTP